MKNQNRKQLAKLVSSKGNNILKLAKDAKVKLKTAQDGDGELGPDDVVEIIEEVLMPAVETMAQVGEAIVEGVPGGETSITDGILGNDEPENEDEPTITETTTDDDGEDDDRESRIAKLEEQNKVLIAKDELYQKQALAKDYGNVYAYKRAAAEKEILDSKESLDVIKMKVAAAQEAHANFKEAGMMKQSVYNTRVAKMRTASEGKSLSWKERL